MEDLKAAITAGVITQHGSSKQGSPTYLCKFCPQETDIPDIKSHLRQNSHRNLLSWEALSKVSASAYLMSVLPKVVRKAKKKGHIQALDRNKFAYDCKVCTGKAPFNGLQLLEAHLKSRDHINVKNQVHMTSPTRKSTASKSSSTQKASGSNSTVSVLSSEIQTLLKDGIIQMTERDEIMYFVCHICNDLSMTGVEPLKQHIQGKQHKKNEVKKACLDLQSYGSISSAQSSEVEQVFQDEMEIIKIDEITYYRCLACNSMQSGEESFNQHIQGNEHKQKRKQQAQLVPDAKRISKPSENMECSFFDTKDMLTEIRKIEDIPNKKKNKVVVLNYKEFLTRELSKRDGADKDSSNLLETFTNLGYDVAIHENLTALQTEDVLEKLQRNTSMEALILIILSHGRNKYHFYTHEGSAMDLDKIRKKFTDTGCPQLRGKPKIFLSNFCRGQDTELQTDSSALIEVPHHTITIHASVDNIKTLRHPRNGTIFIISLCKVLKKDQSLQEVLDKLYETMKEERGTTPMMETFPPYPSFTF